MPVTVYANTITSKPTYFPAALALIQNAREQFQIVSENWPYPTGINFGMPRDRYYAEVWVDGMDWQPSYWFIEAENYNNPVCLPLMIFERHAIRESLSEYDFNELCKAIMWYRRDILWIKNDPRGIYNDTVWPTLKEVPVLDGPGNPMKRYSYRPAASQPKVEFWINGELLPKS